MVVFLLLILGITELNLLQIGSDLESDGCTFLSFFIGLTLTVMLKVYLLKITIHLPLVLFKEFLIQKSFKILLKMSIRHG